MHDRIVTAALTRPMTERSHALSEIATITRHIEGCALNLRPNWNEELARAPEKRGEGDRS